MKDSESIYSAKVQFRGTILAALIGSAGIIAAAWIGLGIGRGQSEEQLVQLQQQLEDRDAQFTQLHDSFKAQQAALEEVRKELQAERTQNSPLPVPAAGRGDAANSTQLTMGGAGHPVAGASSDAPRPPEAAKVLASAREQGFVFDVITCRDEGSSIQCDIVVTNKLDDRWIWISSGYASRTYLVDMAGNTCSASKANFEWGTLARDVPFRVKLQFDRCPREVTSLSYLELGFQLGNPAFGSEYKVSFRDIPVTRI